MLVEKRESTDSAREAFVRWQGRTIEQFTSVNNLFTGLATGLLAFQAKLVFDDKVSFTSSEKWLIVSSIILETLSSIVGGYLPLNRLRSFRTTAQIAKNRGTNERENIDALRDLVNALDRKTWQLLPLQTILFILGGLLLLIVSLLRLSK